jgi:hypothetical protein
MNKKEYKIKQINLIKLDEFYKKLILKKQKENKDGKTNHSK